MSYPYWVTRLQYKPGWKFTFRASDYGSVLDIHATVPHSVTLEPTTFLFTRLIPGFLDQQQFIAWVKTVLIEAEIHELREFFRFEDELVDDPHAPVGAVT